MLPSGTERFPLAQHVEVVSLVDLYEEATSTVGCRARGASAGLSGSGTDAPQP
jgi:hypothetical protein